MQFLKWPFLMLWRAVTFGSNVSAIATVADRVDRHGDRFRNASDSLRARLADEYAGRIRHCFTESGALELEEDFLVAVGLKERAARSGPRSNETDSMWTSSNSSYTGMGYGGSTTGPSSGYSTGTSEPTSSDPAFTGGGGESGGGGASGSWDSASPDSGTSSDNS